MVTGRVAACTEMVEVISNQAEADLASSGQFDIHLRKQLRVNQSAVLHALAAIDSEAHAQGVEAVLGARMFGARQGQGVDHATGTDRRSAATFKLEIQETEVERSIMRDQSRIPDKLEQIFNSLREAGLVGEKDAGEAMHRFGVTRHLALRIEVSMEMPTGLDAVINLDAADLDHPVAADGIQSRSFRIKHNFPHYENLSTARESETSKNVADLAFSCG